MSAGPEHCKRCQRPFPGWESKEASSWEAGDEPGASLICPGCLTGAELTEMAEDMEDTRLGIKDLGYEGDQ